MDKNCMTIEQCTCCHVDLEESQIGLCDDCQLAIAEDAQP